MRIIIVTLPRTGGTNFGKWLATELSYEFMSEPVNYKRQNLANYDLSKDNIVVKYTFDELNYRKERAQKRINDFDFSIVHYRKNTYEEARSWSYHNFYKTISHNLKWHEKYFIYQNWENKNLELIKEKQKFLENKTKILLELKSNLVTTYEGIYNSDEHKKLESIFSFTSKNLDIIDTTNRYYQGGIDHSNKKNKTLL